MIANTHRFEQKIFKIADLTNEVKELRSEFVDRRSELMKLKMESTVSKKMEARNIFPSQVPPQTKKITRLLGFFPRRVFFFFFFFLFSTCLVVPDE